MAAGQTFALSGAATLRVDGVTFFNSDVSGTFLNGLGSGVATCHITFNAVTVNVADTWSYGSCSLTAERSKLAWIGSNPGQQHVAISNGDFTFRHGIIKDAGVWVITNSRALISNVVFLNTQRAALQIGGTGNGNSDISFSTFINSPLDQTLNAPRADISNCIISGGGLAPNAVNGNGYLVHYSLLQPQSAAPPGSDHTLLNVDPQFTSTPAGDYHLMGTSPAVNAADPLSTLADDLEGTMRPQGSGRDLGAYEYKP